jgi:hypothetical protein
MGFRVIFEKSCICEVAGDVAVVFVDVLWQ